MPRFLFLFALLAPLATFAQLEHEKYNWDEEPKLHTLSEEDSKELAVGLKDVRMVEFFFDNYFQNLVEYSTTHVIVKINSAESIDEYNKIYIPSYGIDELVQLKARIITADGKVQESGRDQVRTAEAEEGKPSYKYLALEGLEEGCEVEYMYTTKEAADYKGNTYFFQDENVNHNVEFHLYSSGDFGFVAKSYNGFPEIVEEETETKQHLYAIAETVPSLKSEPYSAHRANLQSVSYKLDRVKGAVQTGAVSYARAARDIFSMLYEVPDKKVQKQISKELKALDLAGKSDGDKARLIEAMLKNTYQVVEIRSPEFSDLKNMLKSKLASNAGIMKLFVTYFREADIEYAVVLTADRFMRRFDPDFESYDPLREYLIYVVEADLYLAPTERFTRMQYVPAEITANYGLFVRFVEFNGQASALSDVQYIPTLDHTANSDNMDIDLHLDLEEPALRMELTRSFLGYSAMSFGPIMGLVQESERKSILTELLNHGQEDATVENITYENDDIDILHNTPFVFKGTVTAPSMVEKAGPKYIVKIGETIGPQVEMYQPEERKMDVENEYNRTYHRVLRLHIPEGYKVTNPEVLNLDIFHEAEGERTATFTSTYKMEGDVLEVTVHEYYNEIRYDKSEFEAFREVINAAADFNKVVLFLEKE